MGIDRRGLLKLGGAAALGLAGFGGGVLVGKGIAAPARTRFDVSTAEGREMLRSYARGVAAMKALPPTHPLSWTFQWYTHWIGAGANKTAELERVFGPGGSKEKTIASLVWSTCRGHLALSGQSDWFCPWHRAYLHFFESMIRETSGDADFTLPYWDYTNPDKRALPIEFRGGMAGFEGLFVEERNDGVNDGTPLDQLPLYPLLGGGGQTDPLGNACLDKLHYLNTGPSSDVTGFNAALDQAPHGAVHVLVGTRGNMGTIANAARDPIFWIHHCNIDRLWASWNAAGGVNPVGEWLDQNFAFTDHQGDLTSVEAGSLVDTAPLGYGYDRLLDPPEGPIVVAAEDAPSSPSLDLSAQPVARAVELGRGETRVEVGIDRPASDALSLDATSDARTVLVLRNLATQGQPSVLYTVFVDVPDADGTTRRVAVGTINFFNAATRDLSATGGPATTFNFDVTDVVAPSRLPAALPVTIAPTGEPDADAQPVVGEIYFSVR